MTQDRRQSLRLGLERPVGWPRVVQPPDLDLPAVACLRCPSASSRSRAPRRPRSRGSPCGSWPRGMGGVTTPSFVPRPITHLVVPGRKHTGARTAAVSDSASSARTYVVAPSTSTGRGGQDSAGEPTIEAAPTRPQVSPRPVGGRGRSTPARKCEVHPDRAWTSVLEDGIPLQPRVVGQALEGAVSPREVARCSCPPARSSGLIRYAPSSKTGLWWAGRPYRLVNLFAQVPRCHGPSANASRTTARKRSGQSAGPKLRSTRPSSEAPSADPLHAVRGKRPRPRATGRASRHGRRKR